VEKTLKLREEIDELEKHKKKSRVAESTSHEIVTNRHERTIIFATKQDTSKFFNIKL